MVTYIDVEITSKYENPHDLIIALRDFAGHSSEWEFLAKQSDEYASRLGEPSCVLLKLHNKYNPAVAITARKGNVFCIANIVPKEYGQISMEEYNSIAKQFVVGIKEYAKLYKLLFSVKTTHESIGLAEIIKGKRTRVFFERYLNLFPRTHHPCDIERLDTFICAAFRYSRGKIDFELLKGWLIAEKNWSENDASWCVLRIETGFEILKANKKF